MYFIRCLRNDGVSLIYEKLSSAHGIFHFLNKPYRSCGYVSYDRAFNRLSYIKLKNPDLNLDIIRFDF